MKKIIFILFIILNFYSYAGTDCFGPGIIRDLLSSNHKTCEACNKPLNKKSSQKICNNCIEFSEKLSFSEEYNQPDGGINVDIQT